MFYEKEPDYTLLRFGDVIKGFFNFIPEINDPIIPETLYESKLQMRITMPKFSVIVTPCCNIEEKTISLAPLLDIPVKYFSSPAIRKDFTLLNTEIDKQTIIPPHVWEGLPEEKKEENKKEGRLFTYLNLFFYAENELFKRYQVKKTVKKDEIEYETQYKMIDFKTIYQLNCEYIIRKDIGDKILKSKCLELSENSRIDLRKKIAHYFGRIPKEEEIY